MLSEGYEEFIRKRSTSSATIPRLMKTIRYGLVATAVARPVLTLVMFGGPVLAAELAHHAAVQTGSQVAGELAVGTAVSVGTEGAAAGMQRPVVNLMTRLFTRFYEERAALLVAILHESVLGRGIDRIAALARATQGGPFAEAKGLVESLGAT